MVTEPVALRIRMYNVGFGDCFLVSFTYAGVVPNEDDPADQRSVRHILFDCGSTSRAKAGWSSLEVVRAIAADCDGRLDAIVLSHRHRDHLSAFGGDKTGTLLAGLKPRLVVRAWTEDPELEAAAGKPDHGGGNRGPALAGDDADAFYLASLRRVSQLADRVLDRSLAAGKSGQSDLEQLSTDQMPNEEAVERLRQLAGDHGEYLWADQPTRLSVIVPGVTFRVLGPPKPAQWPSVVSQADDGDEFWVAATAQADRLFTKPDDPADLGTLGTTRWIVERLRRDEPQQVAGLVRWLDDALNNTSVSLLMEARGRRLLFVGDAQVESWGWALSRPELVAELTAVDVYKVGHHGSRNATPKSLHALWAARARTPLLSLLSTKLGVHGEEHEVPRESLVTALRALGPVHSTDDTDALWVQVAADLPGGQLEVSEGP